MKDFVFKIERASFEMKAVLSDGREVFLRVFESTPKQLAELENKASLDISSLLKEILEQNIEGENSKEFLEDLMENGGISKMQEFSELINSHFSKLRKEKTKN